MKCPYCNGPVRQVTGEIIYPHRTDLRARTFYQCAPCDAYVGCHPGTTKPLGRLANAELRAAKIQAHLVFDQLWESGAMQRRNAYNWLAKTLGIHPKVCHIGMFDVALCNKVVQIIGDRNAAAHLRPGTRNTTHPTTISPTNESVLQ